eukprot:gene3443-7977_t
MMTGVTKGFKYKMRFAYAHFPVGVTVEGREIQVRNFLGEKYVRKVPTKAYRTDAQSVKDELVVEGNDIREVRCPPQTCAAVHGACLVKKKDLRKFLDGIYTTTKGNIVEDV